VISFSPTEEQQMIVTMVKQFANDEMRKIYRECDESGEIPDSVIDTAWKMGLISSNIPDEYGGSGGEHSAITGSLIGEELAWGDLSMTMHILCPALFAYPVLEMGTETQKRKYLPLFCGEKYKAATAALIEPRFGFDPCSLSTIAQPDGNEYVLNGEKCYVPLAAEADFLLVYARENGNSQGFIIEKGTKGLEVGEQEKNMGIKALATYELSLKNCRVPKENRLGGQKGCDFKRITNQTPFLFFKHSYLFLLRHSFPGVTIAIPSIGIPIRHSIPMMPRPRLPASKPRPHLITSLRNSKTYHPRYP
jgi:Acyl-CoA dehydrogenases